MKVELLGVEVELKKEALWKVPLLMVVTGVGLAAWGVIVVYSWVFFLSVIEMFM